MVSKFFCRNLSVSQVKQYVTSLFSMKVNVLFVALITCYCGFFLLFFFVGGGTGGLRRSDRVGRFLVQTPLVDRMGLGNTTSLGGPQWLSQWLSPGAWGCLLDNGPKLAVTQQTTLKKYLVIQILPIQDYEVTWLHRFARKNWRNQELNVCGSQHMYYPDFTDKVPIFQTSNARMYGWMWVFSQFTCYWQLALKQNIHWNAATVVLTIWICQSLNCLGRSLILE